MKAFSFSKRTFKKVLAFIGGTAFITLCVYNVSLGLSDYGKRSVSSYTLEALANGEAGGGSESSKPLYCPNFRSKHDEIVGYSGTTPIKATCCVNGADIDACAFPYEDSRCAGYVTRNSHSHCQ